MDIHKPVFLWIHPQKTSRIRILSTKIAIVVLNSIMINPLPARKQTKKYCEYQLASGARITIGLCQ